MTNTQVKICGITTPEDARTSFSLGADYLGLVFAHSPRRVSTETALRIREHVPEALLVGVFLDAPVDEIVDISRACNLNMVQLHGSESPEYCDRVSSRISLPIIKTFSTRQLPDSKRMRDYKRTSFFLFDLDKKPPGTEIDAESNNGYQDVLWTRAADLRRKGFRIFLAGALNDGNVWNAIRRVRPYCVDVASGVEKQPGIKDHDAMRRFIKEVKG